MTQSGASAGKLPSDPQRVAALALAEDGARDVTSEATVIACEVARARLELRTLDAVLAGTQYADAVAGECGLAPPTWAHAAGDTVLAGTVVATLHGDLAALLRAERPLLNLLQRATGIATATRGYVAAVAGTGSRILHTRKTAPGLRQLDVAAVLAGGGGRHRTDLAHVVLVKDNHWRTLDRHGRSLADALSAARDDGIAQLHVEVEELRQVDVAVAAGATRLLVDNQTPSTLAAWARHARSRAPGIEVEATGGVTLATVRSFAEAGADYVSVGALTHSVTAADLALSVDA